MLEKEGLREFAIEFGNVETLVTFTRAVLAVLQSVEQSFKELCCKESREIEHH